MSWLAPPDGPRAGLVLAHRTLLTAAGVFIAMSCLLILDNASDFAIESFIILSFVTLAIGSICLLFDTALKQRDSDG